MDGATTRGHPVALRAVSGMIRTGAAQSILIVGPEGIGKSTLARDLAAGLLCTNDDPVQRPCGTCRACRLVRSGGHPDLHVLGPEGPGRQVVIGGPGSRHRGVRDLITDLALLPVEGGARVAIIPEAARMHDDAQAALLKTLEEPAPGIVIVLCADDEDAILPTIRSRSHRIRLGPVAVRELERILVDAGAADGPQAARLARLAGGRPGIALAMAASPDAVRIRDELGRVLVDGLHGSPSARLAATRAAASRAGDLVLAMAGGVVPEDAPPEPEEGDPADEAAPPAKVSAAARRRAADALIDVWSDVVRDLILCQRGMPARVRDLGLLDELVAMAPNVDQAAARAFLDRLGRASILLAGNVAPGLVLDDLAVAMPQARRAA